MLLASRTGIRTAPLAPLLALCVVCLWPAARARADTANVKLVVYAIDVGAPGTLPRLVDGAEVSMPRAGFGDVKGKTPGGRFEEADKDFDLERQKSYELTVKAAGFEDKKITVTAEELRQANGKELTVFALLTRPGHSPAGAVLDQGDANAGGNASSNAGKAINNLNGNGNAYARGEGPPGLLASALNALVWSWKEGLWWLGVVLVALVAAAVLAWRRFGVRPSLVRPGSGMTAPPNPLGEGAEKTAGGEADILNHFLSINKSLSEMARWQSDTYKLVESLPSRINKAPPPVPPAVATQDVSATPMAGRQAAGAGARPTPGEGFTASQRQPATPQGTKDEPDVRQSGEQPAPQSGAAGAYRSLVGGRGGSIEPLYLNAENKGSLTDILEDGPVYLCEVGHTQGTFVLFPEGEKSGWVFPNPGLMFRAQALRPVFPSLTESEFNDRKDGIRPRPASKVGEGRWKLEGS
jgi:hypothetical protein